MHYPDSGTGTPTRTTCLPDSGSGNKLPISLSLAPASAPSADGITRRQIAQRDQALFARYRRDRDAATRDVLVSRFLPLALHLARRYHSRADNDDLAQVASIGLLKAIDRFDPERGLAFSSFAVPTILGELKRYFRDHGWTVRVPRDVQELTLRLERATEELTSTLGRAPTAAELAQHVNADTEQVVEALAARSAHRPDSLDRPLSDGEDGVISHIGGAEDPNFERAENAVTINALLDGLTERERLILELRFQHDLTQAEIGRHVGVSQMQISRSIRTSIATLQDIAAAR
jgi:RNA polymerase sigma-B factor